MINLNEFHPGSYFFGGRYNNDKDCVIDETTMLKSVAVHGGGSIIAQVGKEFKEFRTGEAFAIPLNDQMLRKIGFVVVGRLLDAPVYTVNGLAVDLSRNETTFRNQRISPIRFLHQLQNAYLLLFGKEIEVKAVELFG
jgi:hypothetical protein